MKKKARKTPKQKYAPLSQAKPKTAKDSDAWELRLYIAGHSERTAAALKNLREICEEHLQHKYRLEVVDLTVNPALARGDQILAVPTLVRRLPPPVKRIIGDLSNTERVLVGLNLCPFKDSLNA
jgi:circadian clock protein KaiB